MSTDQCYLIVPASGIGSRMNAGIPKQYLMLDNGLNILDQTLKTLLSIDQIKGFVVALAEHDVHFKESQFAHHTKLLALATGGEQRYHSVINALYTLKPFVKDSDWILVHDDWEDDSLERRGEKALHNEWIIMSPSESATAE